MISVFGSINLDIVARSATIPKPGETVVGTEHQLLPGGKGANQAVAARRAGADVQMIGAVGKDSFAEPALAQLVANGVVTDGVVETSVPTGIALISVANSGENAITVSPGANHEAVCSVSTLGSFLLLQNEVTDSANLAAIDNARHRGCTIIYNAAPARELSTHDYSVVDWLIVNEHEFVAIAKSNNCVPASEHNKLKSVSDRLGCNVVVTLGAKGLIAIADGEFYTVAAPSVDVIDTTGAGDAFCGALAAALDRQLPIDQALQFAVTAGSLACQTLGAQHASPTREQIEQAMR